MDEEKIKLLHDQTRILLNTIRSNNKDHLRIFNEIENLLLNHRHIFKREITGYKWQLYLPTHRMIEAAQESAYRDAIREGVNDQPLRESLREFFLKPFGKWRPRYDLVAALGDEKSAEIVLEKVDEQFEIEVGDDNLDKSVFYGLLELGAIPEYYPRVIAIVREGFDRCIQAADGDLVNDTIFNLLGEICVKLNDKQSASQILNAFVFAANDQRNYEMNVVASRLAIYLAALQFKGPLHSLEKYIDYFNDSYEDEEFVVRAKYALWWMKENTEEALRMLQNPEKKKSLGLVAAFLADMREVKALPILEVRLKGLTNKVTIEIFKEAITRLRSAPVSSETRMIWMLGFRTSSEIALGDESDNLFVDRANANSAVDLGIVREADDSTPADY